MASILRITEGRLDDPQVIALLAHHLEQALATSPRESVHALDLEGLRAPSITFWSIWDDATLLGVGALKRLEGAHGEIKSMHTAAAARGRGVGSTMLTHIIEAAKAAGMTRLSLETGTQPYFAAARKLYAKHGFVPCPPFGNYTVDPNSAFMQLTLGPE